MSDIEKANKETVYHDLISFVKSELQGKEPRADCKLCNSKHKKDAHDLYERSPSIQGVFNFLKEKGEEISYGAVRKHLNNHYSVQDSDSDLKDLADRLSKWEKYDTSDAVLLPQYIKLLNIEFLDLVGNRSVGEDQRRKNIELALKISAQIDVFKKQLRDISKEMKPVEVIFTNLHRIIEVKIRDSKSPEVKRILAEIYEQISKDVGDMPIEGYQED